MICFGPNLVEICAVCCLLGYWDDMFWTKFGRNVCALSISQIWSTSLRPDVVYFTMSQTWSTSLWPNVVYFTMSQTWSTSLRPDVVYFTIGQIWSTSLWPNVVYFSRTRYYGLFHYESDLVYFTTTICGLLVHASFLYQLSKSSIYTKDTQLHQLQKERQRGTRREGWFTLPPCKNIASAPNLLHVYNVFYFYMII